MKTTKITKIHPNRADDTAERIKRIEAIKQRVRDKIDNQLVNMVLDNLIKNITGVASLQRAYALGYSSWHCDFEPKGNEWKPGCGVSPEAIKDRQWDDDYHLFTPGEVVAPPYSRAQMDGEALCTLCGRGEDNYRHKEDSWI